MESPDQPNDNLKPETGTGFINVINEEDWYHSPRTMEVIKSFDKECIAKLEDRVAQKDKIIQQMSSLQAESQQKLDAVYEQVVTLQEKQNRE